MEFLKLNQEVLRTAWYWSSFSPEKRTEQANRYFENEQNCWLEEFGEEIASEIAKVMVKYYDSYYLSISKCASPAVTGPANFNYHKNNRNQEISVKKWNLCCEVLDKLLKKYRKQLNPDSGNIKLSDENVVEKLEKKLSNLKESHEKMKIANKIVRNKKASVESIVNDLRELCNFSEEMISEFLKWKNVGTVGFTFELKNNLQNIKIVEQQLEKAKKFKNTEDKEILKDDCKIIISYAENRVKVFHNTKPDSETLSKFKKAGFRWTPSQKCWQQYINYNSLSFLGIER